ncbi:MAG: hypothetical protein R2852_05535 [Bacteroidia bacterium]
MNIKHKMIQKIAMNKNYNNYIFLILMNIVVYIISCSNRTDCSLIKEYYSNTENIKRIYKICGNKIVDTSFHFDRKGLINMKIIYSNNEPIEKLIYKNGQIVSRKYNNGLVASYLNGVISQLYNPNDSSFTHYYNNGKIKSYSKLCKGMLIYKNDYDSLTSKPIKYYREFDEKITIKNDSIIVEPFCSCPGTEIEKFRFTFEIFYKNGKYSEIKIENNPQPRIAVKYDNIQKWNKIICDSFGCCTIPVLIENRDKKNP